MNSTAAHNKRLVFSRKLLTVCIVCSVLLSGAAKSENLDDLSIAMRPWTGDYEDMVERRMIRVLVPYSMTHYFLDGATERGSVAALGRAFEQVVNRREGLRTNSVHVVFIPTPRHQLISKLVDGLGDIAAGNLTITDSRKMVIDFSEPLYRNSQEVIITGPGGTAFDALEDLGGQEVYVQSSNAYYESLNALNQTFRQRGLPPVRVETLDNRLEPDEIMELVQAGLIPATVVSRHLADFWSQVFTDLNVQSDLVVAGERNIGWAFRMDSPQLAEVLNEFVTSHRHRTEFGNIIFRRYLQNVNWVLNPTATADRERYEQTRPLFEQYGSRYDLDPLLLVALGYQESRLDQSIRSPVGAVGVMQLMPATGASLEVGDILQLEPNIHAGARYLRQLLDLFEHPEVDRLNQTLFALAAYNGGQTRIRRLRRETSEKDLDSNLWFDNVELLSARVIGRENVQYVRNIYKYYLALRLIERRRAERDSRTAR